MSLTSLRDLSLLETQRQLRSASGLRLRMRPFVTSIRTPLADVARSVHRLYGDYPLADSEEFLDFAVSVRRPPGPMQIFKPQVTFGLDGREPFNPLPGDQGFPLLEWGLNWCVYGMCHQYLILHAAVVERHGLALILPAPSGSGKSTLCAALALNGWRLLSDELTLICPQTGELIPHPRPVSLKNASIDVISRLHPAVEFGSRIEETTKGVVAHFAAPHTALSAASTRAQPGWVVLPRYQADAPTRLDTLDKARTLVELAQNAFNYDIYRREGFEMLARLVDRCDCYQFEYSDLPAAIALFTALADAKAAKGAPYDHSNAA